MIINYMRGFLIFAFSASILNADESDILKRIFAAKEKPLADFVSEVVKANPRSFREAQMAGSSDADEWDKVGDLLVAKIQEVGGDDFVIGKKFGAGDLLTFVKLREWLLKSPTAYFNVCYSVIVESTVARSSMALLAEKSATVEDIKGILNSMAKDSVKLDDFLKIASKHHPEFLKAKELFGSTKDGSFDLLRAADELAIDLHETVPAPAKELLASVKPAGLLFASWTAKTWIGSANWTCLYLEKDGILPHDVMALKDDLKKRIPEAFGNSSPMSGPKLYPIELADTILSALANRNR